MGNGASQGPPPGGPAPPSANTAPPPPAQIDPRLPFGNYRECFTLKNYWKTVQRNKDKCATSLLYYFLNANKDCRDKYTKLSHLTNWSDQEFIMGDSHFEAVAGKYLNMFNDVVAAVEEDPSNVDSAIAILQKVGAVHKKLPEFTVDFYQQMEPAFLQMVSEVLEDRFNDKAETLFKNFFSFCNKYLQ